MQHFTGIEYLAMDIAKNMDKNQEKSTWEERLSYVEQNILPVITPCSSNEELALLSKQGDNPEEAFLGLVALRDTANGVPTNISVSLDATASGLQILAAISGDFLGCAWTNLINETDEQDFCYDIYSELFREIGETKFTRKQLKYALMVYFYGGYTAALEHLNNDKEAYAKMEKAVKAYFPQMYVLRQRLLDTIDPAVTEYRWNAPDGFEVITQTFSKVNVRVGEFSFIAKVQGQDPHFKGTLANFAHTLDGYICREIIRRCNYEPKVLQRAKVILEKGIGLFPLQEPIHLNAGIFGNKKLVKRIANSTIRDEALELVNSMLSYKPFPVLPVHDCFRVPPKYGNILRYWYKEIVSEIVESGVAESMAQQIGLKQVWCNNSLTRYQLADCIRAEAEYAIC